MRFPFAADALMFAAPLTLLSVLFFTFGWRTPGWIAFLLLAFVLYFFRDPERVIPIGDDLIVAPADGKVVKIDYAYQSPEHPQGSVCISIFLSIFNVHIQRTPVTGEVVKRSYNPGKFLAAWDHKASMDNEQTLMILDTKIGPVGVKQIAGLIARRIVLWAQQGQRLVKGERFGLIRFGSRVDLILPPSVKVVCREGDIVKGGETVMAKAVMEPSR